MPDSGGMVQLFDIILYHFILYVCYNVIVEIQGLYVNGTTLMAPPHERGGADIKFKRFEHFISIYCTRCALNLA